MIVLSGGCLLLHTLLFLDLREGRFVMGQFGMEWSQYCDINMSSYRGKAGVNLILPDRPQAAPSLLSYLFTLSECKWDINDVTSMAMLTYSAVTLQSVGPIQNFTFRTPVPSCYNGEIQSFNAKSGPFPAHFWNFSRLSVVMLVKIVKMAKCLKNDGKWSKMIKQQKFALFRTHINVPDCI